MKQCKTNSSNQQQRDVNVKKKKNNDNNNSSSFFFVLKRTFVHFNVLVLLSSWIQVIYFSVNECQMTYMYPGYSKVDLDSDVGFFENEKPESSSSAKRKYNLIRYDEKDYSHHHLNKKKDGGENEDGSNNARETTKTTLALFIPGNGGNYAQVRSLAHSTHELGKYSHSYSSNRTRKATTKIQWYAMDFKEELSAFDADAIERQVKSARWVLEEYFGRKIFESDEKYSKIVIVVGHSMGGLVAKYAAEQVIVNNNTNRGIDQLHVTTLATPHAYHPGAFALSSFTNHAWRKRISKKKRGGGKKVSISLMSVSGGMRDWQVSGVDASLVLSVNGDDSSNSGEYRNTNSDRVKNVSTRISCDHLAICWCKQVILSLAVALQRVSEAGAKGDLGDISQYIKDVHADIPPHLGWRGFEDASSTKNKKMKKDDDGVLVDGFFPEEDENNTDRKTRAWHTFASILVARTPNVASAAIYWHVSLSSLSSLTASSGLAFSSLYVLFALIENIAIGAKEIRALRLEVYILFATIVVLVSGYCAAKILHVVLSKILALSRQNIASTKLDYLRRMSVLTHVSISGALAAIAPALVHAYLIIFKYIFGTGTNPKTLTHSCCSSFWALFLLLPAFVTKVKDGNLPGGLWSAIDLGVGLCTAVRTILVYTSKNAEMEKKRSIAIITSLLFCAASSGAGMASLVHLGLLFSTF